ncbi:nucleoside deaminase [Olivibacter sitiensis]|uniref:nucleoside deaminase n=1 Tax=Olivibacter sitiensis TaxID=376470 RepID=UPI000688A367|nr:nucleoside deaminase [Olivibacter sitiensis]
MKDAHNTELTTRNSFMREAIALSHEGMNKGAGGPFGAVVVRNGEIIARGYNRVLETNDPTCHAEVDAIRKASAFLGHFHLEDCELYTSCEPCPMCLGAVYWSRIKTVYYGNTKADAAAIGFDDQFIYEELDRPIRDRSLSMERLLGDEAAAVFNDWAKQANKKLY